MSQRYIDLASKAQEFFPSATPERHLRAKKF